MTEVELIPGINADSFEEIAEKIRLIEGLADKFGIKYIHLDAADGTFTKNTIWHNPGDLVGFKSNLKIEVHLMISDIDRRIENWLFKPIERIIFHMEAARDPKLTIQKCKDAGIEVGLAVKPKTSLTEIKPYWENVDLIQILGVLPGKAGQSMSPEIMDKIKTLRRICPSCIIEVDGGVNAENAKELASAGANILSATSAIFAGDDIKKAIENLKSKIS
ncbi:MAG: ribulose-phosphate 3-epimerase [Patescibacteria group bacterium]